MGALLSLPYRAYGKLTKHEEMHTDELANSTNGNVAANEKTNVEATSLAALTGGEKDAGASREFAPVLVEVQLK